MSENIYLTDLKRGQKAVIAKLAAYDDMRRRLQDIGLIEGTIVECLGKSPLGDPTAFLIRGAVIALRSEDSGRVLVQSKAEEKAKHHCGGEMVAAAVSLEEQVWD
ncbi:FeoA family protein [Lacrimispora indolis]|uniref:FeoA family protein n=1 Tax=Lacrimispora indolis TaxID=69825 RepID=UPI00042787BF|nr:MULTISPECIES: FeoA family protein [Lachnospiraceae]MBE7720092.1 ferrous iron transport protein A [Lacrimispora celerecrescens]